MFHADVCSEQIGQRENMPFTDCLRYAIVVVFISVELGPLDVSGIQNADFKSEWLTIESQTSANSMKMVAHSLGEVPIKVKVLVRPSGGSYDGWIFEATSSQQADDSLPWLYCGIIYTYNATHVNLYAPIRNQYNNNTGRAFCIDSASWTSGNNVSDFVNVDNAVMAQVLAWKASSIPWPDFDSDWRNITVSAAPTFIEFEHGLQDELSLVFLQARCLLPNATEMTYAEGTGAGSYPKVDINRVTMTGVLYAYNQTHIRVWTPNRGKAFILGVASGYSDKTNACQQGEFRVRAWISLGRPPEVFTLILNGGDTDPIPDMSMLRLNPRTWNSLDNFIQVQVKALDGPNEGFIFPAAGQTHRNVYPGTTYGGVVFAYSYRNIRIFVPANRTATRIHVPENWGVAEYNQTSNNVEITVKIWSSALDTFCSSTSIASGLFQRFEINDCPRSFWIRCLISCLSDLRCVGIIPCFGSVQCFFVFLNELNRMVVDNTLRSGEEILLQRFQCA